MASASISGFHAAAFEQRLDLGGKAKYAVALKEEKRLLTDMIAREKQARLRPVPDRERKHPAQVAHAVGAVLFVEMDDDFRVRGGLEFVTLGLEVAAEIKKVVDLAVKNNPNGSVFVAIGWRPCSMSIMLSRRCPKPIAPSK